MATQIIQRSYGRGRPRGLGKGYVRSWCHVDPRVVGGIMKARESNGDLSYRGMSDLVRDALRALMAELGCEPMKDAGLAQVYMFQNGLRFYESYKGQFSPQMVALIEDAKRRGRGELEE